MEKAEMRQVKLAIKHLKLAVKNLEMARFLNPKAGEYSDYKKAIQEIISCDNGEAGLEALK